MCCFSWKTFKVNDAFANVNVFRTRDHLEQLVFFEKVQIKLFQPLCSRRCFTLVFLVSQSALNRRNSNQSWINQIISTWTSQTVPLRDQPAANPSLPPTKSSRPNSISATSISSRLRRALGYVENTENMLKCFARTRKQKKNKKSEMKTNFPVDFHVVLSRQKHSSCFKKLLKRMKSHCQ